MPPTTTGNELTDILAAGGVFVFTLIYFVRRTEELTKDQKTEKAELKAELVALKKELRDAQTAHAAAVMSLRDQLSQPGR